MVAFTLATQPWPAFSSSPSSIFSARLIQAWRTRHRQLEDVVARQVDGDSTAVCMSPALTASAKARSRVSIGDRQLPGPPRRLASSSSPSGDRRS